MDKDNLPAFVKDAVQGLNQAIDTLWIAKLTVPDLAATGTTLANEHAVNNLPGKSSERGLS